MIEEITIIEHDAEQYELFREYCDLLGQQAMFSGIMAAHARCDSSTWVYFNSPTRRA